MDDGQALDAHEPHTVREGTPRDWLGYASSSLPFVPGATLSEQGGGQAYAGHVRQGAELEDCVRAHPPQPRLEG